MEGAVGTEPPIAASGRFPLLLSITLLSAFVWRVNGGTSDRWEEQTPFVRYPKTDIPETEGGKGPENSFATRSQVHEPDAAPLIGDVLQSVPYTSEHSPVNLNTSSAVFGAFVTEASGPRHIDSRKEWILLVNDTNGPDGAGIMLNKETTSSLPDMETLSKTRRRARSSQWLSILRMRQLAEAEEGSGTEHTTAEEAEISYTTEHTTNNFYAEDFSTTQPSLISPEEGLSEPLEKLDSTTQPVNAINNEEVAMEAYNETDASSETDVAPSIDLICSRSHIYTTFNRTLRFNCTVVAIGTRPDAIDWKLRALFITPDDPSEKIAARAVANGASDDLDFSGDPIERVEHVFACYKEKGELWTSFPEGQKYDLKVDQYTFILTMRNIGASDDGYFDFALFDDDLKLRARRNITISVVKKPSDIVITAMPVMLGQNLLAECTVWDYYPLRAVTVIWKSNGEDVDPKMIMPFWRVEEESGATFYSRLMVNGSGLDHAPLLTCYAKWKTGGAYSYANVSASSRVYHPPIISVEFANGLAICKAQCVPDDISVTWLIDSKSPPNDHVHTNVSGPCVAIPGYVDLYSTMPMVDVWRASKYTCRLNGYPFEGDALEFSKYYDASIMGRGRPVIATIITVFAAGVVFSMLILIMALCFYSAWSKDLYAYEIKA